MNLSLAICEGKLLVLISAVSLRHMFPIISFQVVMELCRIQLSLAGQPARQTKQYN